MGSSPNNVLDLTDEEMLERLMAFHFTPTQREALDSLHAGTASEEEVAMAGQVVEKLKQLARPLPRTVRRLNLTAPVWRAAFRSCRPRRARTRRMSRRSRSSSSTSDRPHLAPSLRRGCE